MRYSLRGENAKKQTPAVVIEESDDELSGMGRDELAVVAPKTKGRKGPDVPIGMHSILTAVVLFLAFFPFVSWK